MKYLNTILKNLVLFYFISINLILEAQEVEKEYLQFFLHFTEESNWSKIRRNIGINNDIGRSFALIAGVSEYPNLKLGNECEKYLKPAAIDIKKISTYLINYEGFEEVVVLHNENVDIKKMAYFLQTYFAEKIKKYPKSRFLFAYSGHGITENNIGYLLQSTATNCHDKAHSINLNILKSLIEEVVRESHHSLVLINSCYGGKFLNFGSNYTNLIPEGFGAHAITAGSSGELTYARNANEGSIFFEKILAGLDGRANNQAIITASDLSTYLKKQIRGETNQKQNPQIGDIYPDGSKGEFFFINRDILVKKDIVKSWNNNNWDWLPFGKIYNTNKHYKPTKNATSNNNNKTYKYITENNPSKNNVLNNETRVKVEVYTCSSIYDIPDQINGKTVATACDGIVEIILRFNEKYFLVKTEDVQGYLWIGSIRQNLKTPKLRSNIRNKVKVFTCSNIYDIPDIINGKTIATACDGVVEMISKYNDNYFIVQSGQMQGYLWKGFLKTKE